MAARKKKPITRRQALSPVARETRASERPRVTDDDVKAAVDIIRRDYYQDVHGIGDEIKDAIESGEISDQDALESRIHQEVDGSQRVIYTYQSRLGLLVSDNDEAYEDQMGEATDDVAVKMFYAMQQDVIDYIGDVDFD